MKTKKIQLHSDKRKGGFNCCASKSAFPDSKLFNSTNNENCNPIDVKSGDPCYGNIVNCLNYISSFRSFDNCQIDKSATHLNFHNAVTDCELIYNELSLPHLEANRGKFAVNDFSQMKKILVDYDERSMQLPGLLVFLHFLLNLHNSIVDEFRKVKPTMSVTAATFEARKITCGVFQNIILEYFFTVLRVYQS
jgi:hypothetical protein